MGMTLGQMQRLFAIETADLIQHIYLQGYECSLGEAKRSDEQAYINSIGKAGRERLAQLVEPHSVKFAATIRNNGNNNGVINSVHQSQLAIDLNLFKDGKFLDKSEDHQQFGEWWERRGPLHRWGGRWGDGNHYSFEFNGVK